MKMMFAASLLAICFAAPSMAGQTLPCNPAVQNWANGSGDTCPMFGGGMQRPSPVKPHPVFLPPPPAEEEETPPVVEATLY